MTATLAEEFDRPLALTANTIELSEASLQWATQTLQNDDRTQKSWQHFLQMMAIAGFKQWLEEGTLDFSIQNLNNRESDAGASRNLQVGDYQLCIVAMGGMSDEQVEIYTKEICTEPNVVSDSHLAHLYVLVEVHEEINQVCIVGGLWRSQLLAHIDEVAIAHQPAIHVPIAAFNIEPEQFLISLNCLEPMPVGSSMQIAVEESTAEQPTAEQLTVEQPAIVSRDRFNVSSWLTNQLGSLAEQMRWVLLPSVATAMRSVREPIDIALEALSNQGVQLPSQASGVGGPISVGSCVCQLYAWAWTIEPETESETPEWTLFLLLGPSAGQILPEGIQLQVSDDTAILTTEALAEASNEAYLYTQVQGTQQEQFKVKVILPDGLEITLPAFSF